MNFNKNLNSANDTLRNLEGRDRDSDSIFCRTRSLNRGGGSTVCIPSFTVIVENRIYLPIPSLNIDPGC
jgi:hypothetical protein